MIPIMGFCQLTLFGGYAIYFPELFPTRLRSTGTSFCYNVGRLVAAARAVDAGPAGEQGLRRLRRDGQLAIRGRDDVLRLPDRPDRPPVRPGDQGAPAPGVTPGGREGIICRVSLSMPGIRGAWLWSVPRPPRTADAPRIRPLASRSRGPGTDHSHHGHAPQNHGIESDTSPRGEISATSGEKLPGIAPGHDGSCGGDAPSTNFPPPGARKDGHPCPDPRQPGQCENRPDPAPRRARRSRVAMP